MLLIVALLIADEGSLVPAHTVFYKQRRPMGASPPLYQPSRTTDWGQRFDRVSYTPRFDDGSFTTRSGIYTPW